MNYPGEAPMAREEWDRARVLHQNYLERRHEEPSKAGEHLWGAINCLASAIHRLENGTGLTRHGDVMAFLDDLVASTPELEERHRDAPEDLHGHYYHDHLGESRVRREIEDAKYLYDYLTRHLGELLEGED